MTGFAWGNPVRTGSDDGPTIAERTHIPNPAAVERLKRLMAEQAAERERRRQDDAAAKARAGLHARLLARAKVNRGETEVAAETEPPARPKRGTVRGPRKRVAPRLDENAVRALHVRHLAGETIRALAAEVGLHSSTLGDYFKRHGLRGQLHKRLLTDDEAAEAFAAHAAGTPWQEIADTMGISARTLRGLRRKSGEAAPGGARLNSSARRIDDDQVRALYARCAGGESLVALEAEAQIAPATLRRRFRALGLPPIVRPSGPAPFALTAEQIDAAMAARKAGQSWRAIAADMGCSRKTLALALGRGGRSPTDFPSRASSRVEETVAVAAAVAAREAGQTWDAIAAELGWRRQTLVRAVRRAGHSTGNRQPKRREPLTEDDLTAIIAERAAGQTLEEVAVRHRIDRKVLSRTLKERGVVVKSVVKPAIELDDEYVRGLHARHMAGEHIRALAREAGVHYATLTRRFRRLGLARVGGARPRWFSGEQIEAAVTAHAAGRSWKDIAAEYDVSPPTLQKAVRRAGHDTSRPASSKPVTEEE